MKIMQVVGYKNSGKTTLVTRLIQSAKKDEKKVSVIKHHGHNGALEMPHAETDSIRFFDAGAASSLAYGNGVIQMHMDQPEKNLEQFLHFSKLIQPDIILIEGFKEADYPKIVLVRSKDDWQELKKLANIQLVITHKGIELANTTTVDSNNFQAIDEYFLNWMEGERNESIQHNH